MCGLGWAHEHVHVQSWPVLRQCSCWSVARGARAFHAPLRATHCGPAWERLLSRLLASSTRATALPHSMPSHHHPRPRLSPCQRPLPPTCALTHPPAIPHTAASLPTHTLIPFPPMATGAAGRRRRRRHRCFSRMSQPGAPSGGPAGRPARGGGGAMRTHARWVVGGQG